MADDGGYEGLGMAERSEKSGEAQRSNGVTAYAAWVIRWRWPVILLALVVAGLAASGGRFLSFSTDYRVFFSEENPQLQAFEDLQNIYTKDDTLLFVVKPAEGEVFTPETLKALSELTEASWRIPFTTRVDSLTNFQHSFAEGDDLTVQDLVPEGLALTPENLAQIRDVALNEPLLINRMVSPDATTTAVAAVLTMPQKSPEEVPEAMAYARDLAAKFRAAHPDLHVAVTGLVALNNAFSEASVNDLSSLVPLMYGVLLLTLLILLRSVSGVVTTVAVIGLSAGTAMGLAGWFGIKLTPPSAAAPTIILTLAVADSVHLLVTLFGAMRGGMSKREAIVESLRVNFYPVFLTSLTTVIGFLSLNFSDAPPFRDLGNITSMGVIAAWIYSVLFLPALMAVLPVRVKPRANGRAHAMERLAEFVVARRRPLMWGMTGLVVALAVWIPRIELNDQFVNYFEPDIQFRVDTDFAMENLSGIYQLNFSVDAGETGGISEPDYLAKLGDFTEWLRAQPGVVHVQSLTDTMHAAQQEHARRRPELLPAARSARPGGPVLAAVRDVPALRPGPQQPDQRGQVGKPRDRHPGKHLDPRGAPTQQPLGSLAGGKHADSARCQADRPLRDVQLYLGAQHQRHARRHGARPGADLVLPDPGLAPPEARPAQPGAQHGSRRHGLRRLGHRSGRARPGRLCCNRDQPGHHRRRHGTLPEQVPARPA